jgi:hypothetical protein
VPLLNPKSGIDNYVRKFSEDKETERTESTVKELIAAFPKNERIEHVLTKVVTINSLYHARVLDVDLHPLALHIHGIENLDDKLDEGSLTVVDDIWRSEGTRQQYFSFATKFCNWHNPDAYAIYDTYMWEALCAYRKAKSGFVFKDNECKNYACFHAVVTRFQSAYDLGDCSRKKIDKFLWILGYELIKAKREKKAAVNRLKPQSQAV